MVISDESVVLVPAGAVVALLSEPSRWTVLWPGCRAVIVNEAQADAPAGRLSWQLKGALVGSSWVTVEERADGVRVEYRLEADPSEPGSPDRPRQLLDSPHGRREAASLQQRHLVAWKRSLWALAAQYERVIPG